MKGTIKRRRDFQAVYERGRRAFGEHLVVFGLRSDPPTEALASDHDPSPRIGIVASRKVGNAVRRNRAKRVMRAALQPLRPYLPPESLLVLVARSSLALPEIRTQQIEVELAELLARIEMLEDGSA